MKKEINLPNIWGQGQIFAFSGLEGENTYTESLVGTLLADNLGFQFRNLKNREDKAYFIVKLKNIFNIYYKLVSSDTIIADIENTDREIYSLKIVFVNQNTFVLKSKKPIDANLLFDYDVTETEESGATVYEGGGNTFAIAKKTEGDEITIAVSYYNNTEDKAVSALDADIDGLIDSRIDFYRSLPTPEFRDKEEEMLFYKCMSILRSTVYTPEGKMSYCSLTPDRFPHRAVWLWDTAYLVAGLKYMSYDVAKQAVLAILQCSTEDGFLPHMTMPDWQSDVTQPPVLSWAALELYKFGGDKEFLAECYERLAKYVTWDITNRDVNGNGLPEWVVGDDPFCRCAESGLDNTPRFDEAEEMDCIDFAAFIASDVRCLAEISKILGKDEESQVWREKYEFIKEKTNEILWDEEDGFYYDRKLSDGKFHKVKSSASFITIFAGICDKEKLDKMIEHLNDPNEFGTAFPIPTVSADYKTYHTRDMFHGPVWLNFNYLVVLGLKEYGYDEEAKKLAEKTIDTIKHWYINEGTIYEFYDSMGELSPTRLSRKGPSLHPYMPEFRFQSVRDFPWGACAVIDFLETMR